MWRFCGKGNSVSKSSQEPHVALLFNQQTLDGSLVIEMQVDLAHLFQDFIRTFREDYGPDERTLDEAIRQVESFLADLRMLRRTLEQIRPT